MQQWNDLMSVKKYDRQTIHQLQWPDTPEGEFGRRFLMPLIQRGAEQYIKNAQTEMAVLKVGEHIVPISINAAEYGNSYLLSSYFVVTGWQEKLEASKSPFRFLLRPCATFFGQFLRWMKINKVVIINNWLMTTNPYPDLTAEQIKEMTEFLKMEYPDHYFMFRSVYTFNHERVFDGLQSQQFRMIPCRYVYLYDPSRKIGFSKDILRKQRKDYEAIMRKGYSVELVDTLTDEEIERVLDLYSQLYIGKYTRYSPIYTPQFIKQHLEQKTLKLQVLKKDDRIFGVNGFLEKYGVMLHAFLGYDTTVSQNEGIYRMLSALVTQEIEARQVIAHQGTGAPSFKKQRGCYKHLEYIGIYDRHLPLIRRLFWKIGALTQKAH